MKKIMILFAVLLILPITVSAVEISTPITTGTIDKGEYQNFEFTITNDADRFHTFTIEVDGPQSERIFLDVDRIMLNRRQSTTFNLGFFPKDPGSFQYKVTAQSVDKPDVKDSVVLYLSILQTKEPEIKEFTVTKIGDDLLVEITVFSKLKNNYDINFEITDSIGNVIKIITTNREIEGTTEIAERIGLADIKAGDYYVKANIPELGFYKEASFYVEPLSNIVKTKKVISSLLSDEIIIVVENKGNTEEDFSINEEIPSNLYSRPVDTPDGSYYDSDKNVIGYNWEFTGLAVGQQAEIRYVVDKWKNYAGWAVVILGCVAIIGMITVKTSQPTIRKHHVRRRKNHLVVLEIKGSMSKKLNNVIVKDRITPLAKVDEDFEGPKPVVLKSESGTELIWRLGSINPRSDSILLTYKVNPIIEAKLKMPRAYLAYRNDDDKKFRVFSKPLVFDN